MSTGLIHARITEMREAAVALKQSALRISEGLESVDSEVKAIGPDRYMSTAAEDFRREYNRLTPELREAYDHLMRFHEKLMAAADEIEMASRPAS